MSSTVLALTDVAHGEETGWRRGQHLIDALPYIDTLTPESKAEVESLIKEELTRSTKSPADYFSEMPEMPPSWVQEGSIVAQELERVARGEAMAEMDTSRYDLDPPGPSHKDDPEAWGAAVDNAHSQLEHQYTRLINLELMIKFGGDAWRLRNDVLSQWGSDIQRELEQLKQETEALNRSRKLAQQQAGQELGQLAEHYHALLRKNAEIETACRALEAEVEALQGGAAAAKPAADAGVQEPAGEEETGS